MTGPYVLCACGRFALPVAFVIDTAGRRHRATVCEVER